MTLPEIKEISVKQYLDNRGIKPEKEYGSYGMYHCPYREDLNASFKVDYNRNLWYDFGTNEGGSIIDLVMKMEKCSFNEAATKLEKKDDSFSSHRKTIPDEKKNDIPTIVIKNIIPITHSKLIVWVQERRIDLDLVNKYCREVHYRNNEKDYFSIEFRNDRGGYELSSPPNFKGCFPPKEITTLRNGKESCLVFEGFWDFLSYLTLQKVEKTKHNVVVLNSTANVQKAIDFLKAHKEIYIYLDNDEAGRKATGLIKSVCQPVNDRSKKYAGYKDLNDYLCQKPMVKPEVKKKKRG